MSTIEVWLVALSLAMDCFAVSIASGIILKQVKLKPMLLMAFCFGLFQALMPLVGWIVTNSFSHLIEQIDHWIAFSILTFLGGQMIVESFKEEEDKHNFDPTCIKVILGLAVATSIDALVIGATFAFLGYNHISTIISPIGIIGLVSFIMSIVGLLIGIGFGNGIARKLKAERLGGIVLVAIGIKILIEHLFFQ